MNHCRMVLNRRPNQPSNLQLKEIYGRHKFRCRNKRRETKFQNIQNLDAHDEFQTTCPCNMIWQVCCGNVLSGQYFKNPWNFYVASRVFFKDSNNILKYSILGYCFGLEKTCLYIGRWILNMIHKINTEMCKFWQILR